MTRFFASATRKQIHPIPLPPMRLVLILAASIVLHFLLLAWGGFDVGMTLPALRKEEPITVALRTPPPIAAPAVVKPKAQAVKEAKAAKHLPPKARFESGFSPVPPLAETMLSPPATTAVGEAGDTAAMPMPLLQSNSEPNASADDFPARPEMPLQSETAADVPLADSAVSALPALEQSGSSRSYRVAAPPPADLKYDVRALRDGQNVYGSGRIVWQPTGNAYRISGEAGVLFFNVLEFHSEGGLDDSGVAPVLYSEKRFRKPLTTTHFQRDEGLIRFSTSAQTYPHRGGEQDRGSIVWQLAGIGRGDPEAFRPDADITVFVAGARNGETWHVRVVGEEEIDVDAGAMRAWHVVREPRPGSYDQKLDIWFAPGQEWYPVRLRYTERNGDWLEMSLLAIRDIPSR